MRDYTRPLTATTNKDIVLYTRTNPVIIALAGTTFAAATEDNVSRMSKEILALQNMLQASEQKITKAELEKKALEEEVQELQAHNTSSNEAALTIQGEGITLEVTIR